MAFLPEKPAIGPKTTGVKQHRDAGVRTADAPIMEQPSSHLHWMTLLPFVEEGCRVNSVCILIPLGTAPYLSAIKLHANQPWTHVR
jgi:hypothetical protein